MNKYLLLGLVGVGGYLLYMKSKAVGVQAPSSLTPYSVAPNLMSQPQQVFPFNSQTPVQRQDNSNQPWYQATRNFITPAAAGPQGDTNFLQNVQYVQGVSEIGKSVASLWDDLSASFGSSSAPDTSTPAVQSTGGIDWSKWGMA